MKSFFEVLFDSSEENYNKQKKLDNDRNKSKKTFSFLGEILIKIFIYPLSILFVGYLSIYTVLRIVLFFGLE